MVEIRKGINHKPASTEKLVEFFESQSNLAGCLYIGYPILFSGGESTNIDALWISKEHGMVVFDIVEGSETADREPSQNELFGKVSALLMQHKPLFEKRKLQVDIEVVTWAPAVQRNSSFDFPFANSAASLKRILDSLGIWESSALYEYTLAVIQSVIKLKVANKRTNVKKENSRGAKLKALEATISHLDQNQERAIIESFDCVQRIRGLAGSGKTIVLALKVAYLHAQNPTWKIAVTFNTRSLKNQFKDLIERFCIEKKGEMPDWEKVKIIHAWGSHRVGGIYFDICKEHGIQYFDFKSANNYWRENGFGDKSVFEPVCQKALDEIKEFKEEYDAILVDEAQDLSIPFLQLCFKILKKPKRLVYAYDELQKLNDGSPLGSPEKTFGIRKHKDTILYKCYRNSRPVLVTAHSLGFGIYRGNAKPDDYVQFFDKPQLWKDVGYEVESGELAPGKNVVLIRDVESSPDYLETHSELDDILKFKTFADTEEQAKWVASEIEKNLTVDELLHKDIIVINPQAITTKIEVAKIRAILYKKNINCHIAGDFDTDVFFEESSIAFTGIHRAKGNEVPMVYIINANYCLSGNELRKKRNTLFTAITRSKAWVRICGIAPGMDELKQEYENIVRNEFKLKFKYPSKEEIQRINLIHRDMTEDDLAIIKDDISTIKEVPKIIQRIKSGKNVIDDYPADIQEILKQLL